MYWPIAAQLHLSLASKGQFVPWNLKFPYPKVLLADCCWHEDQEFLFYAEHARRRGTQIWGTQHGGAYGMLKEIPKEEFERKFTDRWFGWGWAPENLPSPWLVFPPRIPRPMDAIWQVEGSNSPKDRFGSWVYVRPYPAKPDKRQFRRFLDHARLVILDCYGTPLLEAMAANVPTLIYSHETLREDAISYIRMLESVGIWHPNADSVRKTLNHLDIEVWWRSVEVQAARAAFVERFAKSQTDWMEPWLQLAASL